ncbi:MAG: hypothetical protein AAGF01_22875 [Cyanobacteria bacterium P01_G01_bin.38]
MFATLPTGTYRYVSPDENRLSLTLLLRKSGSAIIGVELLGERELSCFRGQAQDNRIVYVTQVYPPYDPASDWQSGQVIEMASLVSRGQSPTAAEQEALETCVQLFWR